MHYTDRIYGSVEITEPAALEIIATPEFQRLRYIDQAGYSEARFPNAKHSRFEHSLGVYELLRRFGAPLAEQIAGLLHDVSHSAFSHTIDYIVHDGSGKYQTYQDEILTEYLQHSSIAPVLRKYGYALDFITDDKNFPLKETELPKLCADRIDYSLRGFVVFGVASAPVVSHLLSQLEVADGRWFFSSVESARHYANLFKELNDVYYSDVPTAHMFKTTADYILRALDYGYIQWDDLYTTDTAVLEKIKPHHAHDLILQKFWLRMNNKIRWEAGDSNGVAVYCKSRCVDPLCRHEGAVRRLSDIHSEWKGIVAETLQPRRHFLKFYD
jgi:hypothetical protein